MFTVLSYVMNYFGLLLASGETGRSGCLPSSKYEDGELGVPTCHALAMLEMLHPTHCGKLARHLLLALAVHLFCKAAPLSPLVGDPPTGKRKNCMERKLRQEKRGPAPFKMPN